MEREKQIREVEEENWCHRKKQRNRVRQKDRKTERQKDKKINKDTEKQKQKYSLSVVNSLYPLFVPITFAFQIPWYVYRSSVIGQVKLGQVWLG